VFPQVRHESPSRCSNKIEKLRMADMVWRPFFVGNDQLVTAGVHPLTEQLRSKERIALDPSPERRFRKSASNDRPGPTSQQSAWSIDTRLLASL
jgi:hypothetical protein